MEVYFFVCSLDLYLCIHSSYSNFHQNNFEQMKNRCIEMFKLLWSCAFYFMVVKINFSIQFCHMFLQYIYLFIEGRIAFCPQFCIMLYFLYWYTRIFQTLDKVGPYNARYVFLNLPVLKIRLWSIPKNLERLEHESMSSWRGNLWDTKLIFHPHQAQPFCRSRIASFCPFSCPQNLLYGFRRSFILYHFN